MKRNNIIAIVVGMFLLPMICSCSLENSYSDVLKKYDEEDRTVYVSYCDVGLDEKAMFITEWLYGSMTGAKYSIDCDMYVVINGKTIQSGSLESYGTAYPVSVGDGYLYTGSGHSISKYALNTTTGKLERIYCVMEIFDEDANVSYTVEIDGIESPTDEDFYKEAVEEFLNAEPLEFKDPNTNTTIIRGKRL